MSLFASLSSHVVSLLEKELLTPKTEEVATELVIQEVELLIKKLEHILDTKRKSNANPT